MSLLDEAFEPFTIIDKRTVADGYGGFITEWIDGAEIRAAVVLDTSMQARIGEAQGVKNVYTIVTKKNINLQPRDIIRRNSDSKMFRISTDGYDKKTPNSAELNMRTVTAEEFKLPNE